jgi:hypothetical protein
MCHRQPGAKKFILASGPRMATKTVGFLAAIADHLWTVKNADFAVVTPTITTADDGGCWSELTTKTLPDWIGGDFGMKWVTTPKQKGTTKKLYFEVTNKHGGVSRCHLDSLQYEEDVEAKFKNKNYSGIYVSELSYFKKRTTFDCWRQALRGIGWSEWELCFMGDTNPAEEGKNSWIWKLWWEERMRESSEEGFRLWQNQLGLMEFSVADNIFKDENWHKEQAAMYQWSEDLLRRYYHGEWVEATGNSVFHEVFRPNAHILGEYETGVNKNPKILMPDPNCTGLITGWDIGAATNHAMVILDKEWVPSKEGGEVSRFSVLDEVVLLKTDYDIDEFVQQAMDKILWWEEQLEHEVFWRNWSDRSAFDMRGGMGNVYHHQLVRTYSEGKIILQAVDRSPGSVRQRLDITKKLFFQDRLYVCRSRCPFLIESLQGLPPGKAGAPINKESHFKHVFDSLSYALISECMDEIMRPRDSLNVGQAKPRMITVPL